jgi:hypothetical protein
MTSHRSSLCGPTDQPDRGENPAMTYYPDATWQHRTPSQSGVSPDLLKQAIDFAVAGETKAPRDLVMNHYQTFGREPFGYAIGPIRERGDPTGIIIRKGYIVACGIRPRVRPCFNEQDSRHRIFRQPRSQDCASTASADDHIVRIEHMARTHLWRCSARPSNVGPVPAAARTVQHSDRRSIAELLRLRGHAVGHPRQRCRHLFRFNSDQRINLAFGPPLNFGFPLLQSRRHWNINRA